MIGLGLDTAKNRTGWAFIENMNILEYGHIECPKDLAKIKVDDAEFSKVLMWYYDQIKLLFQIHIPNIIVMERLNLEYNRSAKTMIQFQTVVRLVSIREFFKNVYTIHNKTVKSAFKLNTPKNKIPISYIQKARDLKIAKPHKLMMVDKINEIFDTCLSYDQDDEADAIALVWAQMKGMANGKIK